MAGISSKAAGKLENRNKYQQYEFNNDFDINLYESFYRTHDPQLGRFWQVDPKPTESESPYVAMGDNPISNVDPKGDYFFGLFGSTSEQRKGAKAFAAETGGEVNNITSKNVSVSFAKTIDEKTGDVAVGKTSFHKDGFAKVFGSEAHQVFKNQSWALEHGTGRIDPSTGEFQRIPANGQANMVDDPITMLGPGLLRGLFTKLASTAAASLAATGTEGLAGGGSNYLYHYTSTEAAQSISQQGLKVGRSGFSYLTNNGSLSPIQAQIELALPANRALTNSILRIDASGLDPALIRRVTGNLPGYGAGGGTEFLFNQNIPASLINIIK